MGSWCDKLAHDQFFQGGNVGNVGNLMVDQTWVGYSDLIVTSLKPWLIYTYIYTIYIYGGIIPKLAAHFRLTNYEWPKVSE